MYCKPILCIIILLLCKVHSQNYNVCTFFKEDRNEEWEVAYEYNLKKANEDINVNLCECNEDDIYESLQECCSACTDYVAIMGLHFSNHTLFLDELIEGKF